MARMEDKKIRKVNGENVNTTVTITAKETESGSVQVLCDELNAGLQRMSKHVFNIRHQYKYLRELKANLLENELIIHVDFSENHNCIYSQEVQSMHFGSSQRQVSLHTGVAYTKERNLSFCTVSNCLKHSPAAIWAHMDPILKHLKEETDARAVHFITDGPTTQYRNKQIFYLLSTKIFDYGFQLATWNILEAGHGKGAADGIGAVVKRTADGFVLRGGNITSAEDIKSYLQEAGSKVKMWVIHEQDVADIEKELPLSLKPLPRTMQIHQILVTSPGNLKHRLLSCFCMKPAFCDCYAPETTSFAVGNLQPESDHAVPIAPIIEHRSGQLLKIQEIDENLVSQYCVVKYDGKAFPGIILAVDQEDELEVKVMHRVGRNRFFWPTIEDTLWYAKENIITLL